MRRLSIRARLTAWYAGAVGAALALTMATIWIALLHGIAAGTDQRIDAQRAGLERFSQGLEPELTVAAEAEEYREYGDVSLSDALFQVNGPDGDVLYAPGVPGWPGVVAQARTQTGVSMPVTLAGQPYRARAVAFTGRRGPYTAVFAISLASSYQALAYAASLLQWLIPLLAIVAGVCGYFVSARALRPIDALTGAAASMDVGHLDRRLDVPKTDDELQRLATTFNSMLDRLQAGVSEIASFTSEASHELRTPVSLIRTTAELALRRARSIPEYEAALTDVLAHSTRLSVLVADLLTMARADAGVEESPFETGDLAPLVTAVIDGQSPGHTRLVTHLTPAPVHGSPTQLTRLIAILVDNATKYTPPPGRISVSTTTDADGAVLIVEDTGVGIAPSEQSRLFERFFRTKAARASSIDGHGLGLAIASQIVQRHGGTIALESPIWSDPDRPGARFTVRFPHS